MKILLSFVGFVNLHIAAAANGLAGDVLNEVHQNEILTVGHGCSNLSAPIISYNVKENYACAFYEGFCTIGTHVKRVVGPVTGELKRRAIFYNCVEDSSVRSRHGADDLVGDVLCEDQRNKLLSLQAGCNNLVSPAVSYTVNENYSCTFYSGNCDTNSHFKAVFGPVTGLLKPHATAYTCLEQVPIRPRSDAEELAGDVFEEDQRNELLTVDGGCKDFVSPAISYTINQGSACNFFSASHCGKGSLFKQISGAKTAELTPHAMSYTCIPYERGIPVGRVGDVFCEGRHQGDEQLVDKPGCTKLTSPAVSFNVSEDFMCTFYTDSGCEPNPTIDRIIGPQIGELIPHAHSYNCIRAPIRSRSGVPICAWFNATSGPIGHLWDDGRHRCDQIIPQYTGPTPPPVTYPVPWTSYQLHEACTWRFYLTNTAGNHCDDQYLWKEVKGPGTRSFDGAQVLYYECWNRTLENRTVHELGY